MFCATEHCTCPKHNYVAQTRVELLVGWCSPVEGSLAVQNHQKSVESANEVVESCVVGPKSSKQVESAGKSWCQAAPFVDLFGSDLTVRSGSSVGVNARSTI